MYIYIYIYTYKYIHIYTHVLYIEKMPKDARKRLIPVPY